MGTEPHRRQQQLICYYSDSRDPNHSQKISHQASADGVNWAAAVDDVALSPSSLRPGMPVVSKLPNGSYFMTYEVVNEGPARRLLQDQLRPAELDAGQHRHGRSAAEAAPITSCFLTAKILFNDFGSGNVLINTSNASRLVDLGRCPDLRPGTAAPCSTSRGRDGCSSCPAAVSGKARSTASPTRTKDYGHSAGSY